MGDVDDDDFMFVPSGRSTLPNLFTGVAVAEEASNQSLTYVAPKQPKKNDVQTSSKENKSLSLLHAGAAHTYKLENGKYESQGVLGVAILGNHETFTYKILLYKGKQQPVTWSTISSNFTFHIEPNNYAMFPDDREEKWSVMFNSDAALIEFAKQVALAKANSFGKNLTKVIVQDLTVGEDASLENGDSAEITYTGWLLINHGFGVVFDTNVNGKPFRFRLGSSKVIKGWNDGIVGAKKGTQRLLIVPPSHGYGTDGIPQKIPSDAVLIFEIFVNKVKHSSDASHSPSPSKVVSDKKPDVPSRKGTLSNDENIVRARGASLSEQLGQSPQKDKAKLISRMAKMGMATLPMQGLAATHTSSESETEKEADFDQQSIPRTSSIPPSPRHLSQPVQREADFDQQGIPRTSSIPPSPQHLSQPVQKVENEYPNVSPSRNISHNQQQFVHQVPKEEYIDRTYRQDTIPSPRTTNPQMQASTAVPSNSYPFVHHGYPATSMPLIMSSAAPSVMDSHLPLLIAETRSQNTEVRLNLSKISDKVDTVIQKLEDFKPQGQISQAPYMESTILSQNIERIIQENTRLKQDVEGKNNRIQELNEKICDILQRSQKFFEDSSTVLEQKSDSLQLNVSNLQNKVLLLETERGQLSFNLNTTEERLKIAQSELEYYKKLENELREKLKVTAEECEKNKSSVSDLKDLCFEKETSITSLKENLEEVKTQNSKLVLELKTAEKRLSEKEASNDSSEKSVISELQQLQEELKKASIWEKKYDTLFENARSMKEQYEKQISHLITQIKQLQNTRTSTVVSQDVSAQIKRAMNALYKSMQAKVQPANMYPGSDILQLCLSMIRGVTFSLLETKPQAPEVPEKPKEKHNTSCDNNLTGSPKSDEIHSEKQARNSEPEEVQKPSIPVKPDSMCNNAEPTQDIISDSSNNMENNALPEIKDLQQNLLPEKNIESKDLDISSHIAEYAEKEKDVVITDVNVSNQNDSTVNEVPTNEELPSVAESNFSIQKTDTKETTDEQNEENIQNRMWAYSILLLHYQTVYGKATWVMVSTLLLAVLLYYYGMFVDGLETTTPSSF